jgi:hypothetical protein
MKNNFFAYRNESGTFLHAKTYVSLCESSTFLHEKS